MSLKLALKFLPYALALGLLAFIGSQIYKAGSTSGAASIQALWDTDTKLREAEIAELVEEYETLEREHRLEHTRITHELAEANKSHAVAVVELRSDYERRLRLSSERAAIYQRQAQGGSAQCRDLGEHAARLDTSLEEGRSLVRELRETLGLRDRQLRAVGQQLLSDRALFTDDLGESNGR